MGGAVSQLGAADRIGLLSDTAALVTAGAQQPTVLLTLLAAYGDAETDETVWTMLLERLSALCSLSAYATTDEHGAELASLVRSWCRGIVPLATAQ
jgi:hypothetical protein